MGRINVVIRGSYEASQDADALEAYGTTDLADMAKIDQASIDDGYVGALDVVQWCDETVTIELEPAAHETVAS